ncbi:hydrolase carbon-nitrogen family [Penicillium malachiteum]|uniref:Hydrolase carbon-nitrogen family n=1 Tax=Penicillium malachiteum TaxID=1324776 RepID=A0AAD6HHB1_9EURO|nr:hydrolase carbon-nitrogen family [Penicillium malachiteum]
MSTRRVAIIQWHIKELAIEENYSTACNYIREAASQGAELAVLSEYHLSGWAPTDERWSMQAGQASQYLTNYQSLAKELKICLVPGTIIEKETGVDNSTLFYNTAYFISNDGTFPEAFRELIADRAEIVIIPTFWTPNDASAEALRHNPASEALFLSSTLTSRCYENTCGIIFVNAAGPAENFLGMSQVTLPIVGPVAKMGNEEGVLVTDMDLGLLDIAERNYKVREDIQTEGWHYVYRHTSAQ